MRKGTYPSSNGRNTIAYYVYEPGAGAPCGTSGPAAGPETLGTEADRPGAGDGMRPAPRAVVQISHGMCEYLERYGDFAAYLNDRGILVCGNDHLGHGGSVDSGEDFGYFAERDGWRCLVEDAHRLTVRMKEEYPQTPYFLLGHSMGSFIARACISLYGDEYSGAVLMGTSGSNPLSSAAYPLVKAMSKTRGDRFRSRLVNDFAFGTYNAKFRPQKTEYDWLSNDEEQVERFRDDPRCNFVFTLGGFLDLYHLLRYISRRDWAREVPTDLPVLLLSGSMDPVGRYGKGVKEVHDRLAFAGSKDLIIRLYPGCRHELLNESGRVLVYEDIFRWLDRRCPPVPCGIRA